MTGDRLTLETADEAEIYRAIFIAEATGPIERRPAAIDNAEDAVRAYRERLPKASVEGCECGSAVIWHNRHQGSCKTCGSMHTRERLPASDDAQAVDANWLNKLVELSEALGLPDPASQHPSNVIGEAVRRVRESVPRDYITAREQLPRLVDHILNREGEQEAYCLDSVGTVYSVDACIREVERLRGPTEGASGADPDMEEINAAAASSGVCATSVCVMHELDNGGLISADWYSESTLSPLKSLITIADNGVIDLTTKGEDWCTKHLTGDALGERPPTGGASPETVEDIGRPLAGLGDEMAEKMAKAMHASPEPSVHACETCGRSLSYCTKGGLQCPVCPEPDETPPQGWELCEVGTPADSWYCREAADQDGVFRGTTTEVWRAKVDAVAEAREISGVRSESTETERAPEKRAASPETPAEPSVPDAPGWWFGTPNWASIARHEEEPRRVVMLERGLRVQMSQTGYRALEEFEWGGRCLRGAPVQSRAAATFDAVWAEWWGDRGGYYTAHPDKWITDAERVCRHFFAEGGAPASDELTGLWDPDDHPEGRDGLLREAKRWLDETREVLGGGLGELPALASEVVAHREALIESVGLAARNLDALDRDSATGELADAARLVRAALERAKGKAVGPVDRASLLALAEEFDTPGCHEWAHRIREALDHE